MPTPNNTLKLTRSFQASIPQVWNAMTEIDKLKRWWGPKGTTIEVADYNFKPGGAFHYCMNGAAGAKMWGKFIYKTIEEGSTVRFVNSFADEKGNAIRSPFSATWPMSMENKWTLTDANGTTVMEMECAPFEASEAEDATFEQFIPSMQQGFSSSFDRLEAFLSGKEEA